MKHDQITQEIRFAVVLYGGVSLAIYINGVVQELLRLVRSTAGVTARYPTDLDPIEQIYRKLGQALAAGQTPVTEPDADAPVRTRFRIDVISGTSAGGINGVFLAKALANGGDLKAIENLWFDQGALELLLNDGKSAVDLPFAPSKEKKSLLNSQRMYYELLDAFDQMDRGTQVSAQPLADELSLFATTTDIEGIAVPIRLSDEVVLERRHKNVFRFRFSKGAFFEEQRNDFDAEHNPLLAFASRCTSSFPFAFEPMRLMDIDPVLSSMATYKTTLRKLGSKSSYWQKFFGQYITGPDTDNKAFASRSFGDGGYLNNKPFSYAVDALAESTSDYPVDRKLLYVEPSPEHLDLEPKPDAPPNALQNALDALITIPGYQTIREDLSHILDRNLMITRVNQAVAQIETDAVRESQTTPVLDGGPEISCRREELHYRSYYHLRAVDVTDAFATVIARAYGIEEGTVRFKSLRSIVRAWRGITYEAGEGRDLCDYLTKFDLSYRLRRLRFVLRKLDAYRSAASPVKRNQERAESAARFAGVSADMKPGHEMSGLAEMRPVLAQQYRKLLSLRRALLSDEIPRTGAVSESRAPESAQTLPLAEVRKVLADSGIEARMQQVIDFENKNDSNGAAFRTRKISRSAGDSSDLELLFDDRALAVLKTDSQLCAKLTEIGDRLAGELLVQFQDAHTAVSKQLGPDVDSLAARALRPFYFNFDLFDSLIFPMLYGTSTGESEPVSIFRISPEDASALEPDPKKRRTKLKGRAISNFGAFLDRSWRQNDLLWGRLDGAERIISALLPLEESAELRSNLIDQAHAAILADFQVPERVRQMVLDRIAGKHPGGHLSKPEANDLIAAVTATPAGAPRQRNRQTMANWTHLVPPQMDQKVLLEDVARAASITGKVLDDIAASNNISKGGMWLTLGGRALWGLTELAVPQSAWNVALRYWTQLLYLIAIILIAGGILSAVAQLTLFGWSLLGLTAVVQISCMWLKASMKGRQFFGVMAKIFTFVLLGAAVVLIALGVTQTWLLGTSYSHLSALGLQSLGARGSRMGPAIFNVLLALIIPLVLAGIEAVAQFIQWVRGSLLRQSPRHRSGTAHDLSIPMGTQRETAGSGHSPAPVRSQGTP